MVDPPLRRPNGRKCAEGYYAPYSSLKKRLMEWRKLRDVGTQTSPFTCCPGHDCLNDQSTKEGPPDVDMNKMVSQQWKKVHFWIVRDKKRVLRLLFFRTRPRSS